MHTKSYPALLPDTKAAEHLPASVHTLRYWRRIGYGPAFVRIGRRIFYRLDDIDAWLASRPRGGEIGTAGGRA